jgi:hypothetical protein
MFPHFIKKELSQKDNWNLYVYELFLRLTAMLDDIHLHLQRMIFDGFLPRKTKFIQEGQISLTVKIDPYRIDM